MKNIVLAGFMGTGKSAVGRILARRLGRPFQDMDAELVQRFGKPIAEVFAQDGESAFRRAEHELAQELASPRGAVIATGGGALLDPDTLKAFSRHGEVICLTALPGTVLTRAGSGNRPLLDGSPDGAGAGIAGSSRPDREARIRELLAHRDRAYRRIPIHVATDGLSASKVAEAVAALLDPWPERIPVAAGSDSYTIEITPGLASHLAPRLAPWLYESAVIITDENVRRIHGSAVTRALRELRVRHEVIAIPPGERSKTYVMAGSLHRKLLATGAERRTVVIALGGGVVGDLAGFIAATHKRGLPLVHVPTTLVAQLDSAIGGKNGVNLPEAKNQLGTVYPPVAVLADPGVLATLGPAELRDGLAEAVKTAVIGSVELFDLLEGQAEAGASFDLDTMTRVVRLAAAVKARIVTSDPLESGERRLLNLGHTVGHALEAAVGYRRLSHGQAVSIGMVAETKLAVRLGLAKEDVARRIEGVLARLGLSTAMPVVDRKRLLDAMAHDKKKEGGKIHVALPRAIAHVELVPLAAADVVRFLEPE